MARISRRSFIECLHGVLALTLAPGCAAIAGVDFDGLHRRTDVPETRRDGGESTDSGLLPSLPLWRVQAPDSTTELLGVSVAIEGGTALVGARDPSWAGLVYVVTRSPAGPWLISDTLTAGAAAASNAQLGASVALSGDWALLGARGDDLGRNAGAAYFFHRVGGRFTLAQRVQGETPVAGDRFGTRVALDGAMAVVGAPGTGITSIFVRDAAGLWQREAPLSSPDGSVDDDFGSELALRGDTLVVAAPGDDEAAVNAGAVHVFERRNDAWIATARLLPPEPDPVEHRLGSGTIGIGAGTLIVPALGSPTGDGVHAFTRDVGGTWQPEAIDLPPGEPHGYGFGWRAAMSGSTAIVSVRGDADVGHALVYKRESGSWHPVERLAPESDAPDLFGWTVAFDGATAVLGSIRYQRGSGAAYFADVPQ